MKTSYEKLDIYKINAVKTYLNLSWLRKVEGVGWTFSVCTSQVCKFIWLWIRQWIIIFCAQIKGEYVGVHIWHSMHCSSLLDA